jgi:hypothetical protein
MEYIVEYSCNSRRTHTHSLTQTFLFYPHDSGTFHFYISPYSHVLLVPEKKNSKTKKRRDILFMEQ